MDNRINLQQVHDLFRKFCDKEPLPHNYDADVLSESQIEEEISEEIEGLTIESINSDPNLMEELVTKISTKLNELHIGSHHLSTEWFMLEPFPAKEALDCLSLSNKGIVRHTLDHPFDSAAVMYCSYGMVYLKSAHYINGKEILEYANRTDVHQTYCLGQSLYDNYCSPEGLLTTAHRLNLAVYANVKLRRPNRAISTLLYILYIILCIVTITKYLLRFSSLFVLN